MISALRFLLRPLKPVVYAILILDLVLVMYLVGLYLTAAKAIRAIRRLLNPRRVK